MDLILTEYSNMPPWNHAWRFVSRQLLALCEDSFNILRDCLSGAPLLVFPDFNKPFILDTDASDIGIGAVLA